MIRVLLLVCVMMAGVVGAEAVDGLVSDQPVLDPLKPPALPAARAAVTPARSTEQWPATLLARPLFAPDRRAATDAPSSDPALPRLSGIIMADTQALAIFQSPEGKPMVARQGASISGWAVTRIGADAIHLRKNTNEIVLRPRFADAAGAAPSAVPAETRPRWEVAAVKGVLRERWSNPQLQP